MKGSRKQRPGGAVRKKSRGSQVGSGGQGRQALEGKGPTPKAEDRPYHPAGKRKAARERFEAAGGKPRRDEKGAAPRGGSSRGGSRAGGSGAGSAEFVTGRNSVLEALEAKIPASTLYIASRIEYDDRVKSIVALANKRGLPMLEVMRPELDRLAGPDAVHQGVALKVPPYEYAHPLELLDAVLA